MKMKILISVGVAVFGARAISAQCYTFSSGTAASLTVDITHLPPPTQSTSVPWIWDYSSNSGLVANVSLKVGQTTYTPDPSSVAPSIDISVASDSSSNFSDITITAAFFSAGHILVSSLADIEYWSGAYFPNGNLPVALPALSKAHSTDFLVSADGFSGTIFDQTLTVMSISSCGGGGTTTPPAGMPSLTISSTHRGTFLAGQPLAQYTLSVQNTGTVASSGTVYVSDTLPPGMNASALSGNGWSCSVVGMICSRSDSLPAGSSYSPLTLTASVASYTLGTLTNQAMLSGGGSSTSTATDPTNITAAFVDVLPSDPFLPAIDLLKEYGVTSGCQAQPPMFCSNDYVNQAQMAVFIVRSVVGSDTFAYTRTPYFSDVPASNQYFPWIQKMQDMGIALQCGVNQFCPDVPVTRGNMAVLIIRGRYGTPTPSSYPTTPYFTDVPPGYPFFPWIQKMKEQGITSGCSATTYCPDDPVTRGQMAVFIMRGLFNLLTASSETPAAPGAVSFGTGTYVVGKDIPAGRYYAVPAMGSSCYWERLSGLGGSSAEIIANDFIEAGASQVIVDIAATDFAFSTGNGCGTWYNTPRLGSQSSISSGSWLVGAQIAPGTYQTNANSGCYWERLRSFGGNLSGIITNNFVASAGIQMVSISVNDVGFSTNSECGVWTRASSQSFMSDSMQAPTEVKQNWLMKRSKDVHLPTRHKAGAWR